MLSTKLAVCITVWFDGLHNGFRKFVLLNNLTDIAVDALLRQPVDDQVDAAMGPVERRRTARRAQPEHMRV